MVLSGESYKTFLDDEEERKLVSAGPKVPYLNQPRGGVVHGYIRTMTKREKKERYTERSWRRIWCHDDSNNLGVRRVVKNFDIRRHLWRQGEERQ